MTHSLISLHSYVLFNAAIGFGYIISRAMLGLFNFNKNISPSELLRYSRYCLATIFFVFIAMPYLSLLIPFQYHSSFQLEPILKSASSAFLDRHTKINHQMNLFQFQQKNFSLYAILNLIIILGIGFYVIKYINNLYLLFKLQNKSYYFHKIKNVHILINDKVKLPFCWSFLINHFIVIPDTLLEKTEELKLAICHEIQHIRQGDTYWLHVTTLIKSLCFWNPFIRLWIHWFAELQEFTCDETMILRRKTSCTDYAQCLVNVANQALNSAGIPKGVLKFQGSSQSILYRRVNMLFSYKTQKVKKLSLMMAYIISSFIFVSVSFALNGTSTLPLLSEQQVATLIQQSNIDKGFQVTATPEVVNEINNIRRSHQARTFMHDSLQRMNAYKPAIQAVLVKKSLPKDLSVIPLVESGYQPLDQSKNQMLAAGIWQMIPATAKKFGLVINHNRDDRLNTQLSTQAALSFLQSNYDQFQNWKLASIAYEIGETNTAHLIKVTGSHEGWVLARSSTAPADLKKFVAQFDAALIIMHNPTLIA
jgi:beta-lactamase regulating signal transducer with metallopeptidase domain